MLKIAYDAGCDRALQECGLAKTSVDHSNSEDISPEALAAIGAIPVVGGIASPIAAGYYAPRGRILSRVGHNIAGGMLGGLSGAAAGGVGGVGLGALIAHLQDKDPAEYERNGLFLGALLGGVSGGAYGRYAGQQRSQDWDSRAER